MFAQSLSRRKWTIALLVLVVLAPSLGALSALWLWPGGLGSAIYAACKLVLYGIPAIFAFRTLTRNDLRAGIDRGLKPAPMLFGVASGFAIGGGILALWFGVLANAVDTSQLVAVVRESGLDDPLKFWVFAAWLCIGNSFLEELVFRWFIDTRLRSLDTPSMVAVPLSAAFFTMHHVIVLAAYFDAPAVLFGSAGVFTGGLIWSWSLRRWNSLIPGWISHAIVDLAIFVVGAAILGAAS